MPVIEVSSDEAFITASPYESLIAGSFSQVPILMGINPEEGLTLLSSKFIVVLAFCAVLTGTVFQAREICCILAKCMRILPKILFLLTST